MQCDLAACFARSLPLEVVGLEKHVQDLNLDQNPLRVLPDKWHTRFGPKEQASRPAGYTSVEVCIEAVVAWVGFREGFGLPSSRRRRGADCSQRRREVDALLMLV